MTRDELKEKVNEYVDQIPERQLKGYIWDDCLQASVRPSVEREWEHKASTFDTAAPQLQMDRYIEQMLDDGWNLFSDIVCGSLVTLVFSREKKAEDNAE